MATSLIVCGLGNPGPEYQDSRHNLGFWVVDLLGERFKGRWRRPADNFQECRIKIANRPVSLVQPLTYMNLSGEALELFASRPEFDPESLLTICDDTALPLGRLRLRGKGNDGGHNGLSSIIETLGTTGFPRLRLGVGPVPDGADQADFVLSAPLGEDMELAREMARRAADCVMVWVREGIDPAMSRFNTRGSADPNGENGANGD